MLVFAMTLTIAYQRVYRQFLHGCWPSSRVSLLKVVKHQVWNPQTEWQKKPLMKGSETSSVKPVDWRTEKPLTKGNETSSVDPVD